MNRERTKEVRTDLPTDVEFVHTNYEVTHDVVKIGEELAIHEDEKIIHTEIQDDRLGIWMLKEVGRGAFVPEEVEHE